MPLLLTLLAGGCDDGASQPTPSTSSQANTAAASAAAITSLSASDLSAALRAGELSAAEVTQAHLDRIEQLNDQGPALHAVLQVNNRRPLAQLGEVANDLIRVDDPAATGGYALRLWCGAEQLRLRQHDQVCERAAAVQRCCKEAEAISRSGEGRQ